MMIVDGGRWWSADEVAAKLSIPARTVRYRAQKGLLPGIKKGRKIWHFPADVGLLNEKHQLWRTAAPSPPSGGPL
jgi:hypothetical protein